MKNNIGIIGLGYVGLPLAIEFSKHNKVIGYDYNSKRVSELNNYFDRTNEISKKNIKKLKNIKFTNNYKLLKSVSVFIITVPTPINENKTPDLTHLMEATKIVAKCIKKNSIIVYESTVYPGCTEEICLPILEKFSKLKLNDGFFLGYSPERINPGNNNKKISNIIKIVSGSNKYTTNFLSKLYGKIVKAGIYKAESIKIAEAAKIIENTQRDLNIALINECSIIFKKMNLDTNKILEAAETKWNFASYKPGLVGGHCIGVDPYYLTYKAKMLGYKPKVILAGRKINDEMTQYVGKKVIKILKQKKNKSKIKKVLILGLSFKENCVDPRNSKVFDLVNFFKKRKFIINIFDPIVDQRNIEEKYKKNILTNIKKNYYDVVIIAVPHKIFIKMGIKKIKSLCKKKSTIFDLKNIFPKSQTDWQL